MPIARYVLLFSLAINSYCFADESQSLDQLIKQLHVPLGFHVSIFAEHLPTARSLALGDDGVVYVGSRDGRVYALKDQDADGKAEQQFTLAEHLYMPNGVAFKDGALYVVEVNRIIRFDNIGKQLAHPPQPIVIYEKFPSEKHHGWKYLAFGPDGKLYTSVGMSCNICKPEKPLFGTLIRMDADGSHLEILAHGIRNSVGFDWEPNTKQLFFHDNGRDYLGDDNPPEELNLWTSPGQHFGYPYCHGVDIVDPEFGLDKKCTDFRAPIFTYKAHIAPLGMRFYTGSQFPKEYKNQLFVAQHGSWNRTEPQGYQIVVVNFSNGKPYIEKPFITGWLRKNAEVLGRPVDIVHYIDGSLLISDDKLGVIYRVEYKL